MGSSVPAVEQGWVHRLSRSAGGVPKLPVEHARVDREGLEGDRQRNLKYHGGPDRALCLFSLEVIQQLQEEGHPIEPGSAGENITIAGLDWNRIVPGTRLGVGHALQVEITDFTTPCRTIRASFVDGRFSRISQKVHPGASRVYARVLREGIVSSGDPVRLL